LAYNNAVGNISIVKTISLQYIGVFKYFAPNRKGIIASEKL
jgi:hypothetical protein